MIEANLHDVLSRFPQQKVLILGDAILDEYIWGDVKRISPEAPVPVVEIDNRSFLPGGAANTAANVAALSGTAFLGGVLGEDFQAKCLQEALEKHGVNHEGLLVDASRPTTTKTRIVAHNQQIVRVDYERTHFLTSPLSLKLLEWAKGVLPNVDSCILSDYEKGVIAPDFAQSFIQLARDAGKPVVVDPKGKDFSKYRGATVIKPNELEAEQVLNRRIETEEDLLAVGEELLEIAEGSNILLTRGARGMALFRPDREVMHVPAYARHVFDVTGAGDTVVSVLAMALAVGASIEDAARLANRAAGIVVGKVGTATINPREIENFRV